MLRARAPMPEGAELTVPHGRGGDLGWSGEVDMPMVTIDGGAHTVRGRRVAGGAAVLWATVDGERRPSITRMWAIPRGTDSQIAEAWGGRMALELLSEESNGPGPDMIVGDNLPVIRYCDDAGRLRRPHLHAILDEPRAARACTGRETRWAAVRRRFNTGADRAVTEACERPACAAEQGRMEAHCITVRL